jgi:hypothetical protein
LLELGRRRKKIFAKKYFFQALVGLAIHRGKRKSSLKPVKQSGGQNYG